MQKILILILSFFILPAFSAPVKKGKVISRGEQKLQQYACSQKSLPLSIQYQVMEDSVRIELKTESELKGYQVAMARGVDGLKVLDFAKQDSKDVPANFLDSMDMKFTKPVGKSYFILEVIALIGGKKRTQIISIPVGELSQAQMNKRKQNIIEIDPSTPEDRFNLNTEDVVKIHIMKRPSKKK